MNLDIIKNEIKGNINNEVLVYVSALRNKSYRFTGRITKIYPNIFIVSNNEMEKAISYSDVASKDVKITYI